MRRSIGIAALAIVAVAGLWAWTLDNGANARVTNSHGISTAELTMQAAAMPTQQFDAI